ncbi:MAG: hypothetical protein K8S00_01320 [Bacteroidales bacterium]|nr:hypothetical protein [Bacteroidales bacterium]
MINLIINTEKPSILKKLEEVFELELEIYWWDDGSGSDYETIKPGIEETDKGELFS